jgi:hypothetical protein
VVRVFLWWLQAGIETFMLRITGLEGDKAALGEQLRRTRETVTCLQVRHHPDQTKKCSAGVPQEPLAPLVPSRGLPCRRP